MKSTLMEADLREPVDQVEEAINSYVKEQRDRQVTMVIRLPEDIYKINPKTKEKHEPPCLSLIDTEILDGQMHLTCYFRSLGCIRWFTSKHSGNATVQ